MCVAPSFEILYRSPTLRSQNNGIPFSGIMCEFSVLIILFHRYSYTNGTFSFPDLLFPAPNITESPSTLPFSFRYNHWLLSAENAISSHTEKRQK